MLVDHSAEFTLLTESGIPSGTAAEVLNANPAWLTHEVVGQVAPEASVQEGLFGAGLLGKLIDPTNAPEGDKQLAQQRLLVARAAAAVGLRVGVKIQDQE